MGSACSIHGRFCRLRHSPSCSDEVVSPYWTPSPSPRAPASHLGGECIHPGIVVHHVVLLQQFMVSGLEEVGPDEIWQPVPHQVGLVEGGSHGGTQSPRTTLIPCPKLCPRLGVPGEGCWGQWQSSAPALSANHQPSQLTMRSCMPLGSSSHCSSSFSSSSSAGGHA